MQSLLHGLFGKNEDPIINNIIDDFETIQRPDDQIINQIHRRIKLLNEFKQYIKTNSDDSVYYNYIINTKLHESQYNQIIVYTILPGIFGQLNEYNMIEQYSYLDQLKP